MRFLTLFLLCALLGSCHSQKSAVSELHAVMTDSLTTKTTQNDSTAILRDLLSISSADSITATIRVDSIRAGATTFFAPNISLTWHNPANYSQRRESATGTRTTDSVSEHSSESSVQDSSEQTKERVAVADPSIPKWILASLAIAIIAIVLWQFWRAVNGKSSFLF